jgi:hypothetical protein
MAGSIDGLDVESANGINLQTLARTAAMRAEREAIEMALVRFRWNRRKTAEYLSVSYKTLLNKIGVRHHRETGVPMPADPTTQNALIIIAVAVSIQTLLMVFGAIALAVAWKRAHATIDARLGHFSARLDDVVSQTRVAVGALERSAARVDKSCVGWRRPSGRHAPG